VLRLGIESAKQITPAAEPEPEIAAVENPATEDKAHDALANAQPWPSERPVLQEIVSELEASLGGDFLGETESAHVSGDIPETVSAHAPAEFRSGTLDDFVSDLEASLGTDFIPPHVDAVAETATAAHEEPAVRAAAAAAGPSAQSQPVPLSQHLPIQPLPAQSSPVATAFGPTAGVDLSEMFGELKHELEEDVASADEDPETHYNLGVAFREMGLLDEAIGELQKVCQAVDRGHAFPQLMQTYTWLAQCFLDKGVPEVAIRWYEKALTLPSLDQETRTALHYELASSFESAGNNPAALSNFLQVYGSNIDYRDVGERIKALRT
jgi:tetratricopeptide (TPR) repeat protein